MRVRNFEPRIPSLRSAKSFSKLRISTNVSATNRRKIRADNAAKTTISWLLPGCRKFKSKAVCDTRIASKRNTEIDSRMMTCLRYEVFTDRVGSDSLTDAPDCVETPYSVLQVIIDASAGATLHLVGGARPVNLFECLSCVIVPVLARKRSRLAGMSKQASADRSCRIEGPPPHFHGCEKRSRNTCR